MTAEPIDVLARLRHRLSSPRVFEQRACLLAQHRRHLLAALRRGAPAEVLKLVGSDMEALVEWSTVDRAGALAREAAMLPDAATTDDMLVRVLRGVDLLRHLALIFTAQGPEELARAVAIKVPRRVWTSNDRSDVAFCAIQVWDMHPRGIGDAAVEEMIRVGPLDQLPGWMVVRAVRLQMDAKMRSKEGAA